MNLALSIKWMFKYEHILSKYEFTSATFLFNLTFLGTMLETLIVRLSATKPFAKSTMDFAILSVLFSDARLFVLHEVLNGLACLL